MGNGPSLNYCINQDAGKFKNSDLIAINFFGNSEYFKTLKPIFYVLQDELFFIRFNDHQLSNQIADLRNILNSIDWKMVLFVPIKSKSSDFIQSLKNPNISLCFINYTPVKGFNSLENFFYKNYLGMPIPESVIISAIFLAININYKKIHLYGVEHSWLKNLSIDQNNNINVSLNHFYNSISDTDEKRSLSEFLLSQSRLFESHMRLQYYAKSCGVKITNHTVDSYIDAYERT